MYKYMNIIKCASDEKLQIRDSYQIYYGQIY